MTDSGQTYIEVVIPSRTTQGDDVAAIFRDVWEDADLRAVVDDQGAVARYAVALAFPTAEDAYEAMFKIGELMETLGLAGSWEFHER